MFTRKPNPFIPFYSPRWVRMPGAATLEGKPIDVAEAFRTRGWADLTRILVKKEDEREFYPWREGDMFEHAPYTGEGAGYMSRDDLAMSPTGWDDKELERLSKKLFGIELFLSPGDDSPEKMFFREHAYHLCLAAETGKIVP